ncbi:MAG TPA: PASTA domain-containing protein [Pyrinomonadaceae bacterium]|jgi:beta-lactam-binding protein with PASTA domain
MVAKRALSALSKIGIILAIAVAFLFGLAGTVYLSLRSPEVQVPDLKGQDRMAAEAALDKVGLNMKVRATRFSPDAKPDTILDQLPEKNDVIKVGQTVAVVVARGPKEGESAATASGGGEGEDKKPEAGKPSENQNENGNTSATNQNENKPKRTKNANNKNANNSNNSNNSNANRNANNRNANTGNANNRNANTGNRNGDADRPAGNTNANRRPPVISTPSTPPLVPSGPPRMR